MTRNLQSGNGTGQLPWGYTGSFVIVSGLVLVGFVIELAFTGQQVVAPHRPYNIIMLYASVSLLVAVHVFFRKRLFVKWLSSIPCSISAVVAYALLALLMGFIKQDDESLPHGLQLLGLNHLKNSWPFLFVELYLLVSLGLVTLRRSYPLTGKNVGFLLNHAGLWLTLVAAGLGSGDLQRLKVGIYENGQFINTAYTKGHKILILPFSLKLLDFRMEMYNPGIAIALKSNGKMIKERGLMIPLIEKGSEYHLQNWIIRVKEMIPRAIKADSGYVESGEPNSSAVAYVEARNAKTDNSIKGWLCSGSMTMKPAYLSVEGAHVLFLSQPEPRKYESSIVFKDHKGKVDTILVEVNKPFKRNRWSLYQLSYDTGMGQDSNLSEIEAVYDPWLPVVYAGIILMMAGSCYLFWLGRGVGRND